MSREMETMMELMHTQISRAINYAISERIIREIQNMVGNLPLSHYGVEPCTSTNEDGIRNVWKNANTELTKKDSRSACDLTDHADNTPYKHNSRSSQEFQGISLGVRRDRALKKCCRFRNSRSLN